MANSSWEEFGRDRQFGNDHLCPLISVQLSPKPAHMHLRKMLKMIQISEKVEDLRYVFTLLNTDMVRVEP